MSHSMAHLKKKYDEVWSNYQAANFAILHFAQQTSACFKEKKRSEAKYDYCMKQLITKNTITKK